MAHYAKLGSMMWYAERLFWCTQRSINLSLQQKKELLAGRHYYLTKLREVLQQRETLLATLEVTTLPMSDVVAASQACCNCHLS